MISKSMGCILWPVERPADLIALLAVFAAFFSARYAMHSAREVRRSNEIALHNERLKILRGILDLRAKLSAHGVDIKEEDLFRFYEYVQLSEFYFNKQIYEKVNDCYDCVYEMMDLRGLWASAEREGREEKAEMVQRTRDMLSQGRKKINALEVTIKNYLRITES
ncbi:MAG: hypothetical protein ACLPX5_08415 [Dissulfurispiraceae bacterium]